MATGRFLSIALATAQVVSAAQATRQAPSPMPKTAVSSPIESTTNQTQDNDDNNNIVLASGSSGPDVELLQRLILMLNPNADIGSNQKDSEGHQKPDGIFLGKTRQALVDLQKQYGLDPTGQYDPPTQRVLGAEAGLNFMGSSRVATDELATGGNMATGLAKVLDEKYKGTGLEYGPGSVFFKNYKDKLVGGELEGNALYDRWANQDGSVTTVVKAVIKGGHETTDVSCADINGTITMTHAVDGEIVWAKNRDKTGKVSSIDANTLNPDVKTMAETTILPIENIKATKQYLPPALKL